MKKFCTDYYEIGAKKANGPWVRFAHFSDLHGTVYGDHQEGLLCALEEIKPDIIVVTGDVIDLDRRKLWAAVEFFQKAAGQYPVFFSNGNHETRYSRCEDLYGKAYDCFVRELNKAGVTILNNQWSFFTKNGRRFQVAGYEAPLDYFHRFSRQKPSAKDMEQALGKIEGKDPVILLAHNPMYFSAYKEWGADLTFSGHLHGGFIRLPGLGGVLSPQVQLFPRYDKGLFVEEGQALCVSAGLGDHSMAPRFGNPTHLPVVTWYYA